MTRLSRLIHRIHYISTKNMVNIPICDTCYNNRHNGLGYDHRDNEEERRDCKSVEKDAHGKQVQCACNPDWPELQEALEKIWEKEVKATTIFPLIQKCHQGHMHIFDKGARRVIHCPYYTKEHKCKLDHTQICIYNCKNYKRKGGVL